MIVLEGEAFGRCSVIRVEPSRVRLMLYTRDPTEITNPLHMREHSEKVLTMNWEGSSHQNVTRLML